MNEFIYSKESDFASAEELAVMQEQLLKRHLLYCRDNSPFYRDILHDVELSGNSFDILEQLPLTDKSQLNTCPERFVAVADREIRDIVFSSGTTGAPLPVPYTANDLKRLAYNEYRSFLACGMTADDRVLLTCTLDRCFIAGLAYFEGVRAIGAAAIRNGLNSLESHAEVIRRLKPTVLVGVPSFLKRLAGFMAPSMQGADSVRMLICIGEPVRDRELKLNSLGQTLAEQWQAEVYSTYASSETITSFCDCTAGNGGHLLPDLGVAEILDENGRAVPDGEPGELVMTPLQMEAMPLLRFRTGDITFMTREACACGRSSLRIGPILGRRQQMMKINGTTLYPQSVFTALENIPQVADYYILAHRNEHGLFTDAEVHVAFVPGAGEPDVALVRKRLAAHIRIKLPVVAEDISSLRARVFSRENRKPQRFFAVSGSTDDGI